jgi:hypothetical protein
LQTVRIIYMFAATFLIKYIYFKYYQYIGRFSFESVERTCLATTRVPLTSHIFARKYSEDYFQLGLQFLTRNMQRLTIRGVFYFYWDSFLNVCTLLFFQELIRIASAGQVTSFCIYIGIS